MNFDVIRVIRSMGPLQMAVAVTLVVMAVASLTVFIERLWILTRSRRRAAQFATEATELLGRQAYADLLARAQQQRGNHLATLLAWGLRAFGDAEKKASGGLSAVEIARRELGRKVELLTAELRRGFSVLASVGSVAPFVGLLGTVVGVIGAFQGIAREGSGGLSAVSAGIAEALIVTAFGLLVAIPSVLAFNFLSTRSEAIVLGLEQARGELIDRLESGTTAGDGEAGLVANASSAPALRRGRQGDAGAA